MHLIALSLAFLAVLAIVGVLHRRAPGAGQIVYGGAAAVSVLLAGGGLSFLLSGSAGLHFQTGLGLPWSPSVLALDPLSALFIVIINLGAVPASLFAWKQCHPADHAPEPGRVLPFFPLFLLGMNLTVMASDVFLFLLGWELMSVASWLLVLSGHRQISTVRAAQVYLVVAGLGAGALLLAFGLMIGGLDEYSFEAIRQSELSPWMAGIVAVLTIMGAGSKAGLVPLHVWLPLAHPAAPSHVSALMSGVMTKVAIYALVRVLFDLAGTPQGWWGALLMALGALTAVGGILYALFQGDIKRLLAYSTVENIGTIAVALGLALVFKASDQAPPAAIAFAAAMLHAVNHSLYKTLLFLVAGAVLAATGRRELGDLGGLIHRMPATAVLGLVGAIAIAALPPLNGFASEWLTFQAMLRGPQLDPWLLKVGILVAGATLALATALAAACFVKFYGMVFLGRARSEAVATAVDLPQPMLIAMTIPAFFCILLGLFPSLVLVLVDGASSAMVGTPFRDQSSSPSGWLWLAPAVRPGDGFGNSGYSGLLVAFCLVLLVAVLGRAIRRAGIRPVRRAPAWGCGYPPGDPATQYGPDGLSQPLRRIFGSVAFAVHEHVDMPEPGDTRPAGLTVRSRDLAWDKLFTPVETSMSRLSDRIDILRGLTIRKHLTLMFVALIAALVLFVVTQ